MSSTPQQELISRGDFNRLLTAFLALDRTVVELYMQLYRIPQDQQLAMRKHNRSLHGVVRKRVPELLFRNALGAIPAKQRRAFLANPK